MKARFHYVLEVTFDEDLSQIRKLKADGHELFETVCHKPFKTKGRVKNMAQAFRKLWAKPHLAIRMDIP